MDLVLFDGAGYRDAGAAGISKGTLLIAKSALRVRSEKIGTEGWQWSLPEGTNPEGTKNKHPFDSLEPLEPSNFRADSGDPQPAYIKEGTKDVKGTKGGKGSNANLPLLANEEVRYASVAEFFAAPPGWFSGSLNMYHQNPEKNFRPLCTHVAAVVLGDGLRWEEVVGDVRREVGAE